MQNQWHERARKGAVSALLMLATALLLSACGGGASTPATPTDNRPVAAAGTGVTVGMGTSVMLDGSSSADPSGASLRYNWSVTASPSGSTAQVEAPTSARPTFTPDKPGTYTLSLVVSNGQATSNPSSLTIISVNALLPSITLDQSEPVSGSVGLSLAGTVAGAVTWYADLQLLGDGSGTTGAYPWNAATATNGNHLILARIQMSANTFQEVRRTVNVGNSPVTLTASASVTSGTVTIDATALSTNGMSSVTASFDGGPVVTLSAPNACSKYCTSNNLWRFQFAGATSGNHSAVLTATDGSAVSKSMTVAVTVSNAPQVALSNPSDGQLVNGSLNFAGLATTDKTGTISVTARLASLAIPVSSLATAGGTSFSGSYDLTGVTPGSYALTVTAKDQDNVTSTASRTVIITSSLALSYAPVFTMPSGASLVAVEGADLLYLTSDGSYVLRNLDSSTEVILQSTATLQYAGDWELASGRTFATAKDSDCTTNWNCVYEWKTDGTRRNISAASNLSAGFSYQENPVTNAGYVLWTNWSGPSAGSYVLYNLITGSFALIPQAPGVNYVGNINYGVALNNGDPVVYYWGQTDGSGMGSSFEIFGWSNGISTRLTNDGQRNIYVQTDGVRAAWQSSPPGGNADGTFSLKTVPVGSTIASTVSTTANSFKLADGVLAWVESTSTFRAVKASLSSGPVVTLSNQSTASLSAVGSGRVAYMQGGKLYSWDATTYASTLRLETAPSRVWIGDGKLIFNISASVYRVPL
ncbi:PKD domain-containing protein [Niveibacterium sp. SC-1]|uniref:PKD domain-containing protein n=1 Tax=Niveibacterium sp. SC-1 TaxID=3135646 RepID=UPI00311D74D9